MLRYICKNMQYHGENDLVFFAGVSIIGEIQLYNYMSRIVFVCYTQINVKKFNFFLYFPR